MLGIKGLASKPEIWSGYRDHELAFALPDIVLGIGFVASGIMSATGVKMAPIMAIACAGALAFLALLDFAYLIITWQLRSAGMKRQTGILVGCMVAIVAAVCMAAVPMVSL